MSDLTGFHDIILSLLHHLSPVICNNHLWNSWQCCFKAKLHLFLLLTCEKLTWIISLLDKIDHFIFNKAAARTLQLYLFYGMIDQYLPILLLSMVHHQSTGKRQNTYSPACHRTTYTHNHLQLHLQHFYWKQEMARQTWFGLYNQYISGKLENLITPHRLPVSCFLKRNNSITFKHELWWVHIWIEVIHPLCEIK